MLDEQGVGRFFADCFTRTAFRLELLRADAEAGRRNSRVKVMSAQPTNYERYACEWGYALNTEFKDIRVLDLATTPLPAQVHGLEDFWLLDVHTARRLQQPSLSRHRGPDTRHCADRAGRSERMPE